MTPLRSFVPFAHLDVVQELGDAHGPEVVFPPQKRTRATCPLCDKVIPAKAAKVCLYGHRHHFKCWGEFVASLLRDGIHMTVAEYHIWLQTKGKTK